MSSRDTWIISFSSLTRYVHALTFTFTFSKTAQEALEQVENRVEEQLQVLYRRYPTALPAAAKTVRAGRYVAYGLGLLVSIVGALLLWKVLGLLLIVIIVLVTLPFRLLSLIFGGGKKKPAQPQAGGKKKKKNAGGGGRE
jgi:hypothetical protein